MFAILLQIVRHDRLLCCLQQSDSRLRDGDASKKQCLPSGVFRMPTVQPQVLSTFTYTIHTVPTTAESHRAILITLSDGTLLPCSASIMSLFTKKAFVRMSRHTICGNCASINPLMRMLARPCAARMYTLNCTKCFYFWRTQGAAFIISSFTGCTISALRPICHLYKIR